MRHPENEKQRKSYRRFHRVISRTPGMVTASEVTKLLSKVKTENGDSLANPHQTGLLNSEVNDRQNLTYS